MEKASSAVFYRLDNDSTPDDIYADALEYIEIQTSPKPVTISKFEQTPSYSRANHNRSASASTYRSFVPAEETSIARLGFALSQQYAPLTQGRTPHEVTTTASKDHVDEDFEGSPSSTTEVDQDDVDKLPAVAKEPGRSSNLTFEQQMKFKELWNHILILLGYSVSSKIDDPNCETGVVSRRSSFGPVSSHRSRWSRRNTRASQDSVSIASNDSGHPPLRRRTSILSILSHASERRSRAHKFQHLLKDMTHSEMRAAFWDMFRNDTADNFVLRFLRARKWNVEHALEMLITTVYWRAREENIENLLFNGEPEILKNKEMGVIRQLEAGKAFIHGVDHRGRPIVIVRPRLHKPKDQTFEEVKKYTFLIIEYTRLYLREPGDSGTILFDLTGFTLSNMDYPPVKLMVNTFEAHYPECLGFLIIHNAPWVFRGIWKIVKGWLDPVVASKIRMTASNKDLLKFIPKAELLKEYGGDSNFEYTYKPATEDENVLMKDTQTREKLQAERSELIKKFEDVTIKWVETGFENTPENDNLWKQKLLADRKIAFNYVKLDPYIRARSVFDRTCDLKVLPPL